MIRLVIATFFLHHTIAGDLNNSANISESENPLLRSKRIVGGDTADIRQFPWLVSIATKDAKSFCGGSIISANIVLTAAHCFFYKRNRIRSGFFTVRAGSSQHAFGGSEHRVLMTRSHEGFIPGQPFYSVVDVGLMYVKPGFKFDAYRKKVVLAERSYVEAPWTAANIAGWGSIVDGASIVSDLRYAQLTITSPEFCASRYGAKFKDLIDLRKDMCTRTSGKNVCRGDSGGPLTAYGTQLGIASLSSCDSFGFAVFMRVGTYREWIDANSKDMEEVIKARKSKHGELRK